MDDEEVMRNVASEMIGRAGCEIICVESGEKAIESYSASMNAGRKFDIVILDLTVITGMGGEIAVRRLLEIDPNVKAIVSRAPLEIRFNA
jgi:CheY-like chemotaxis protein